MTLCYFDAFSGIAGDMTVAALLDAGAPADALLDGLRSLNTGAQFTVEKTKRAGIAGTYFHVAAPENKKHRHLHHIEKIIDESSLGTRVKDNSKRVFRALGEAEAAVHGIPIEKVHFHEVGAVDSICDIIGACLGLDLLGVDKVYASAVNVGSGTVRCEHGLMPVPAPATARLLSGQPTYAEGPAMELTTPTGAAIAKGLAESFGPMPAMRVERIGFGAGTKDFPGHANVLRVLIGAGSGAAEATTVAVLEANIDDASPQLLGYTMDRLFEQGALDVTLQPLLMKKNRQGTLLTVVARLEDQEKLAQVILRETTTLGLRAHQAQRRVLEREFQTVNTEYGPVRMKISAHGFAPEYDDCQALAIAKQVPLKQVIAAANLSYLAGK
jgi:uncharacterized protein (TIGR00299 family) protein